jgi:hypothetical protein
LWFTGLKATFDTINWDEKPVELQGSAVKVTRVRTDRVFSGDVAGTAATEYVFSYHPKADDNKDLDPAHPGHGTVNYVGLMHFKGTVDGSEVGEVVFLLTKGEYTDAARGEWVVDEKSAIGGLKGIKGRGGYESKSMKGTPAWFELEL